MKRISLEEAENLQPYIRTPLSSDPDFYTIEKDSDGWETTKYYTLHSKIDSSGGEGSEYVYVLGNEYMPGLLKIGYTYNDPQIRASQISKSTGVPEKFKVLFYGRCFNGMRVEKAVHDLLKKYRINNSKEFFKISLEEAKISINQMIEKYG
jgi:hypothetical protein